MSPKADPRTRSFIEEATRLTLRYIDEVVLPYGLCPWARPALDQGRVTIQPILAMTHAEQQTTSIAASATAILKATLDDGHIELVLMPMPTLSISPLELDEVTRAVRHRDRERQFALAAFHPDAPFDTTSAERVLSLLRSSPDPMIQAVKSSTLNKIDPGRGSGTSFISPISLMNAHSSQEATRSPRERVAETNFETVLRVGADELLARIEDIRRDRECTYSRLRQKE